MQFLKGSLNSLVFGSVDFLGGARRTRGHFGEEVYC